MESDDDGFAKQGGEPLDLGDQFDDSEEEPDDDDDDEDVEPISSKPQALSGANVPKPGGKPEDIKGQKIDNQPFDLAVDVNDSEEIESEEDDGNMNVDMQVQHQAAQQKTVG